MSKNVIEVKCTRCGHSHLSTDRTHRPDCRYGVSITVSVCPRCGGRHYHDMTPQVAWCWRSGLIEFGELMPAPAANGGGAIEIARGPKYALEPQVSACARHGIGLSEGDLLLPGIPEAANDEERIAALNAWLTWCRKCGVRDGVTYTQPSIS